MTVSKKNTLTPRPKAFAEGVLPTVEEKELVYGAITQSMPGNEWYTRKAHSNWCKKRDNAILDHQGQQQALLWHHVRCKSPFLAVQTKMRLLPDPPLGTMRSWALELGVPLLNVVAIAEMLQEEQN
ncbi:hypothetical protein C8Q80DRAFT_1151897 [Daedaleopsis nitida]|nr:hypothetical protein C8Q80DRAFT_1151897 [Daedaleopsis nitida]